MRPRHISDGAVRGWIFPGDHISQRFDELKVATFSADLADRLLLGAGWSRPINNRMSSRMTKASAQDLLEELSRLYKFQPATALWRAIEISEVLRVGLPSGSGMDLGCGDGALTGFVYRHLGATPDLIGVDNSKAELDVADRRSIYKKTICASSDDLPIADRSLDFVFSNSVLEHIQALEKTVAEISRVLRTGGTLVATVPAPPFRDFLKARSTSGEARERYLQRIDERLGHYNYLDEASWHKLLGRNKLRLESADPYLTRSQVRRWERLSSMTGGMLQALGAGNSMLYRLQRLTRSDDPKAGGLFSHRDQPAVWSKVWAKLVAGSVLAAPESGDPTGACLIVKARKS